MLCPSCQRFPGKHLHVQRRREAHPAESDRETRLYQGLTGRLSFASPGMSGPAQLIQSEYQAHPEADEPRGGSSQCHGVSPCFSDTCWMKRSVGAICVRGTTPSWT